MKSSVTWPFDSQGPVSYRHSIVNKSPSQAISEIMGTKHIGVITLTFQGHGVLKVAIFTAKGTSLRESTSIEPFCVKIG